MSTVQTCDLRKWFPLESLRIGLRRDEEKFVKAVDGVSISLRKGEIHGLVGESGSGKTTTGKLICKLLEPSSGQILIDDQDLSTFARDNAKEMRRRVQYVFQDPYSSLDDRLSVRKIIQDPLRILGIAATEEDMAKALERCDLSPGKEFLTKHPKQMSGGQRQRLCLARILLLQPRVLIADEVVSMLDVSTRVGVLDLINELRKEEGLTCIFITHDIISAQYLCDRISVMYLGKIVESGTSNEVVSEPKHPYTRLLMASVPRLEQKTFAASLEGEPPDAANVPPGCAFNPRCSYATDICQQEIPKLEEIAPNHLASCHHVRDIEETRR